MKLLLRHYSVAENPLELGFFGAEAAAQQGYGWQYTYLFFRNQAEAERLGRISEDFQASIAGSIGELDVPEWHEYLEAQSGTDGQIRKTLEGYEELGNRTRHPHRGGDDHQRPARDAHPAGRPHAGADRTRGGSGRRILNLATATATCGHRRLYGGILNRGARI